MRRKFLEWLLMVVIVMAALVALLSCGEKKAGVSIELRKKLAGDLRDNKLYGAAIEEYLQVLSRDDLENVQRGTLSYLIARIYFDDLKDYTNAAAYYVRAREYDANGSYNNEATQNLIACLEKMGQYVDARRELGAATDIKAEPMQSGDLEVARIGGTPIWKSEVESQIQALPPNIQKEFLTPEGKRNFVRQYVGSELMYRAALREGYDRDQEIVHKREMLAKNLVVNKYVIEKVMPEVKIDTQDVRNFYIANKDARYKNAPYDSVKAQVFLDYQGEKAQAAFGTYIDKLARSEQVEFLDQNIR